MRGSRIMKRRLKLPLILLFSMMAVGVMLWYLLYASHRQVEDRRFELRAELSPDSPFSEVKGILTGEETVTTTWDLNHELWALIGHWGPQSSYEFNGQLRIGDTTLPIKAIESRPQYVVACDDDIWVLSRTRDYSIKLVVAVVVSADLRTTTFKSLDDRKYLLKFADSAATIKYRFALVSESIRAGDMEQVATDFEAFVATDPGWMFNFRVSGDSENQCVDYILDQICRYEASVGLRPRVKERLVDSLATSLSQVHPANHCECAIAIASAIRDLDPDRAIQLRDELVKRPQESKNDQLFFELVCDALD